MKQKICHDTSCPPYDSYCFYCSRSSGCDSEDFREVPDGSPETIHVSEIARQSELATLLKQESIEFTLWATNNYSTDYEGFIIHEVRGEEPYIWHKEKGKVQIKAITLSTLYDIFKQTKNHKP